MSRHGMLFLAVLVLVTTLAAGIATAAPIRGFVFQKDWAVTLDVPDFEPFGYVMSKTILGGAAGKDMTLTLIVEEVEPGTTAEEVRETYGMNYAKGSGENPAIEKEERTGMALIFYSRGAETPPWGFNGYVVKDDIAFDVHISGTTLPIPKEQLVTIMESFEVEPTSEMADFLKMEKHIQTLKDKKGYEAGLLGYVEKYPDSPWGYWRLAEYRLSEKELTKARDAFLNALKHHKTQPIVNPLVLWQCYDGLGMCYGMAQDYEPSRKYLRLGYDLADDVEEDGLLAASAYNLACWHAETGDAQTSVKFLKEAVRLDPDRIQMAKEDPSFSKIRGTKAFRDALKPPPESGE